MAKLHYHLSLTVSNNFALVAPQIQSINQSIIYANVNLYSLLPRDYNASHKHVEPIEECLAAGCSHLTLVTVDVEGAIKSHHPHCLVLPRLRHDWLRANCAAGSKFSAKKSFY